MKNNLIQTIMDELQAFDQVIHQRAILFQQFMIRRHQFGFNFSCMINNLLNNLPPNIQAEDLIFLKQMCNNEIQMTQIPEKMQHPLKSDNGAQQQQFQGNLIYNQDQQEKLESIEVGSSAEQPSSVSQEQKEGPKIQSHEQNQDLETQNLKRSLRMRPKKSQVIIKHTVKKAPSRRIKKLAKIEKCEFCQKKFVNFYGLLTHQKRKHNITRQLVDKLIIKLED